MAKLSILCNFFILYMLSFIKGFLISICKFSTYFLFYRYKYRIKLGIFKGL